MAELGQNQDPNQTQDQNQTQNPVQNEDQEAPAVSEPESGFRSTPKRNSATESESEPAESLHQYQGSLCPLGGSGYRAIPMRVQTVTPSGSGTSSVAQDLEPVNRARVQSSPFV